MPVAPTTRALARAIPLAVALVAAVPVAHLFARQAAIERAARLDVTITGRVTDASTGQPVEGAQVIVVGRGQGALTDTAGRYVLRATGLLQGRAFTLMARRIGYSSVEREARADGARLVVDFAMRAATAQLQSQVVDASTRARRPGNRNEAMGVAGGVAVAAAAPAGGYAPARDLGGSPGAPGGTVPDSLRRRSAPWNTEEYARIQDNPFLGARGNPLSTFSVDVDRASYANVRRFIAQGQRPPRDAVRIEELVNYFHWNYAAPDGRHPIAVHTEVAAAPWQPRHLLMRIGVQGQKLDLRTAPPNNLVFLVDVSGSMQPENKLPLLKRAFRLLVDELREQDRVSIVVYAGAAGVVLPPTSGAEKTRIHAALEGLEAGGSTAGGAGIRLAYDLAKQHHMTRGNNRVILATDGDFNVGVSSTGELVRLVEERRAQGTFLTVLGFGMGNIKDDRLEQLADKGNGNYAYIDDLLEARKVLVTEMGGTLVTIAKDVKLQVEFNPAHVAAWRLIGYENRLLRAEDFNDDAKDAGEMGAGHTVTALYEIVPLGVEGTLKLGGVDSLRYARPAGAAPDARPGVAAGGELAFVKLRYKQPDGGTSRLLEHAVQRAAGAPSTDFTFAAAVAGFGMLLRESEHKGAADWRLVARLAREGRGPDAQGYRAEFQRLVESAMGKELAGGER